MLHLNKDDHAISSFNITCYVMNHHVHKMSIILSHDSVHAYNIIASKIVVTVSSATLKIHYECCNEAIYITEVSSSASAVP